MQQQNHNFPFFDFVGIQCFLSVHTLIVIGKTSIKQKCEGYVEACIGDEVVVQFNQEDSRYQKSWKKGW